MRVVVAMLTVGWLLLGAAGCVTESQTGHRLEPASADERLEAHLNVVRGYLRNGDTQRARAPLNRAAEIAPNNWEVLMLSATLYDMEGEYLLADEHYRRALRVDRNNPRLNNNYGAFLYKRGRLDEAMVALERAAADPDYEGRALAALNLGLVALAAGKTEQARASFERAVNIDDSVARAHLELAAMAFDRGEYDVALRHFISFRTRARHTPRTLLLGIRIAHAVGDNDSEASYALQLKNLFPDSDEYRIYREQLL